MIQAWSTVHSNLKLPGTQFSAIGIRISRKFCVKKGLKDTVVKTTANSNFVHSPCSLFWFIFNIFSITFS